MSDTEEDPSLTDVLDWSRKASLFIAMHSHVTPEMNDALAAVAHLAGLARLALSSPTEGRLRKAMSEDPYCHAAYAYGAKEALRRASEEISRQTAPRPEITAMLLGLGEPTGDTAPMITRVAKPYGIAEP